MKDKIILIVQHFGGCPNGPAMISNAREAAGLFPDSVVFEEQLIENNEDAALYSFRGSPTLLINGEDFEGMPAPANPVMSCRYYPGGIPGAEDIRTRITGYIKQM